MMPDRILAESLLSTDATTALVETWLERLLKTAETSPEGLYHAMRYAVFAGGGRLRPLLLLQVAQACGAQSADLALALRAACAVELAHVALSVRDDLPSVDQTGQRRSRPSVQRAFGEPMAVLLRSALLGRSFSVLAHAPPDQSSKVLRLVRLLSRATGYSAGLHGAASAELEGDRGRTAAAWLAREFVEQESRGEFGVLLGTAAELGAIAAGSARTSAWAAVGQLFGQWYQLAHDVAAAWEGTMPPESPTRTTHSEQAVDAQLGALLAELRVRVLYLAHAPEGLLAFLELLRDGLSRTFTWQPSDAAARRNAERGPYLEQTAAYR